MASLGLRSAEKRMSESCPTFSFLEGGTPKVFRATGATYQEHPRGTPVAASLLHLLRGCCLFGLVVNADDAQDVSSLKKL